MVDLFKVSDPSEALGNTITAREILDKGAARIETELTDQPAIQATLMDTMGTVYTSLGLYEQAVPLMQQSLAKRRSLAGDTQHRHRAGPQPSRRSAHAHFGLRRVRTRPAAGARHPRRQLGNKSADVANTLSALADVLCSPANTTGASR